MAITNYGKGNWFGLPELGLTERAMETVYGLFNQTAPQSSYNSISNAQGTQPTVLSQNANFVGPQQPQSTPTSSLTSAIPQSSDPAIQAPADDGVSDLDKWAQDYGFKDYADYQNTVSEVGNVYDESYGHLNKLQNNLMQGEQDFYNIHTTPYTSQIPIIQANAQSGINNLNDQIGKAQYQEQDALSAARNLFSELSARNRQAFGGVSSVGQAASEISAREYQKQMGLVKNNAAQVVQGITTKINDVQMQADSMKQQLEQQAQSALSEAKLAFKDKLQEIDNMRNELNQQKAQLKLQAMYEFRERVQYLKDIQTQRTYELENMRMSAIQTLQQQAQDFSSYNSQQNQFAQNEVGQQGELSSSGFQSMSNNNAITGAAPNSQSILNGLTNLFGRKKEEPVNGGMSW